MNEFFTAISKDNISIIKDLCDKYGVDFKDEKGLTPIHCAAHYGRLEIMQILIDLGADVNVRDKINGFTPLHLVAKNGYLSVFKILLEKINDVDPKGNYGQTPLFFAADAGHIEMVKYLIKLGADVNVIVDKFATPLMNSTKNSHTEIVRILLENGADPNLIEDYFCDYPLHIAIENGDSACVELLIKHGADLNRQGSKYGGNPLYRAVKCDDLVMVKLLIDAGVNVNEKNEAFGDTALHAAVYHCTEEILKVLLSHGADTTLADELNKTAIDYLFFYQEMDLRRVKEDDTYKNLLKIFKDHGADLYCESYYGSWIRKPIKRTEKYSKWGENEELFRKALLDNDVDGMKRLIGANLNTADKEGNTLLHHVVIPKLVEAISPEESKTRQGQQLERLEMLKPELGLIELLIENGAKINAVNMWKETALDCALNFYSESDPIIQLLRKHNAKRYYEIGPWVHFNRLGELQ